mgnify:CR=1 FL=1
MKIRKGRNMVSRRDLSSLLAAGTAAMAGASFVGQAQAQSANETAFERIRRTKKLRIGAGANGRTKMTPNRNPGWYSDGYVTYDAMAEYEVLPERLTLKANLINLSNKLYADSLYSGHYIPGFGRTYYLTASIKF